MNRPIQEQKRPINRPIKEKKRPTLTVVHRSGVPGGGRQSEQ